MADLFQTTIDGSEFIPQTSDAWATPQSLFDGLDKEFRFTLDPCCTPETAKCEKYFTPVENGLVQSWKNERVFMNCPYSDIPSWAEKSLFETTQNGCALVVGLLPSWTDRAWFHNFIYPDKADIRFLPERVKFILNGKKGRSPTFGSMVVIWRKSPNYDHCVSMQTSNKRK